MATEKKRQLAELDTNQKLFHLKSMVVEGLLSLKS
jgi:hypothetical protein